MPTIAAVRTRRRVIASVIALACASGAGGRASAAAPALTPVVAEAPASTEWLWPAPAFRIARPYVQPADRYSPGHRGIDLDLVGTTALRSPADGVVAFAGAVADRPVLTIDHGGGLVTTLEPVTATVEVGASVARGSTLGTLADGGHALVGTVHFGVRLHGEYINPLVLLGGIPRAVLLPCC